jgi:hypothetical protein
MLESKPALKAKFQGIPGGPHLIWVVEKIQAGEESSINVDYHVQGY